MTFLKQNYKITSILLIALLFAYIGQLKDNVEDAVSNLVCSIQSTEILSPLLPPIYKLMEGPDESVNSECNYSNKDILAIKIFTL